MPLYRDELDAIAEGEGFPVKGFRLIVTLLCCSFVAPMLHLMPTPTARHYFNIAVGVYAGWFVFDYAILHTFGTALFVYGLMKWAPRQYVGKSSLVILMSYLVCCHAYREYIEPGIVWDATQMIAVLKLTSIAYNYTDGGLPKELKSASMLRNELTERPDLLTYFGFIFFFPTYLAGPAYEYRDYLKWMSERRVAPLSAHVSNVAIVLISAGGFFGSVAMPVTEIESADFYPKLSQPLRCLLMCFPVMFYRFRYYLAWSLAETAGTIAGAGYVEETDKWNGLTNCDILCVEVPTNFRVGINNWNIGVARWLNTYVYQRVALSKSGKPTVTSTMSSFLVSALWHGISPGYYLFFVLGGLYIEVGKQLRRRLRGYFHYTEDRKAYPHAIWLHYFDGTSHPLAFVYDAVGVIFTWVFMQYAGIAFELLSLWRTMHVWSQWYFFPHIVSIGLLMLFQLLPPRRQPSNNVAKPKKQ